MPNFEEKVREQIRSIDACLYTDMVDEAYSTVWGYLLALRDFEIISERQVEDFDREAVAAKKSMQSQAREEKTLNC